MAERIVSPGVFIREKDQSYLAQGIANLGGAVIGPTFEGPALVPTLVSSYADYAQKFGAKLGTTDFDVTKHHYTDETVNAYFEGAGPSGNGLTIVRVLGSGGYANSASILLSFSGSTSISASVFLLPTVNGATTFASGISSIIFQTGSATADSASVASSSLATFKIIISGSGSTTYTTPDISMNPNSAYYITNVLATSANGSSPFYVATDFKNSNIARVATAGSISASIQTHIQSGSAFGDVNSAYAFTKARTPWITNYGASKNLFKVFSISDGNETNSKFKIQVENVKYYSAEERYRFDVVVKDLKNDTDSNPSELERFSGVSLDPNDTKFIARQIGDIYYSFDSSNEKVENGTFANKSSYIYVKMNTDATTGEYVATKTDYPWGFGALLKPINSAVLPPASLITTNVVGGTTVDNIHFGFSYSESADYSAWLSGPVASTVGASTFVEDTTAFSLSNVTANAVSVTAADLTNTARTKYMKFSVPMQGGYDGTAPYAIKKIGSAIETANYYGFDFSSGTSSGTAIYKAAINAISNPDDIDINLVAIPGIIHDLHVNVTNYLITKVEERADCFAIIDPEQITASVSEVLAAIESLDTSYAAVYYPWVKMGLRFVPPSVAVLGAFSQSDKLGAEWFAPAGLNRGGLASFGVTNVQKILKHADRDDLYDGRVNPIARFASQAATPQVVVFGQRTLQVKASALDRINVRRLVINLKKFIASSSKFLVFEQNTSATRQRFLNMVNPYMESVQQRSGLTAFKVVMDDSNNTAEVIDRNQLVGQIYIQPTRTAEFIVLDFVVLPTGAAFPTA